VPLITGPVGDKVQVAGLVTVERTLALVKAIRPLIPASPCPGVP
jgi:hypothetical protein